MESLDINIIYNEIVGKLQISNNKEIIAELEKSSSGAVTASEVLMNQGDYLINLKRNNPPVFILLEKQIAEYIKYCKQNGLIID